MKKQMLIKRYSRLIEVIGTAFDYALPGAGIIAGCAGIGITVFLLSSK
jgi:hypothetical protein